MAIHHASARYEHLVHPTNRTAPTLPAALFFERGSYRTLRDAFTQRIECYPSFASRSAFRFVSGPLVFLAPPRIGRAPRSRQRKPSAPSRSGAPFQRLRSLRRGAGHIRVESPTSSVCPSLTTRPTFILCYLPRKECNLLCRFCLSSSLHQPAHNPTAHSAPQPITPSVPVGTSVNFKPNDGERSPGQRKYS